MLISPERKVSQRSDTSQNDHKSKGYPPKPSEAFTLQKAPCAAAFERVFQKFDFPALVERCLTQFVRVLPYEILVLASAPPPPPGPNRVNILRQNKTSFDIGNVLSISPFSLPFLFIFWFSLHFLSAWLPGCHNLCNPGLKTFANYLRVLVSVSKTSQELRMLSRSLSVY